MLREGDVLAGKYRIERQLGEGGMGYVVAAIHEQLQQRVAVKFLAETHAKNPDAAARFLREARAAVRIQSEHVARVLDVASMEDGSPYMVMEFLLGSDLAQELARAGVFPVDLAVDYVLQACEAVAEAHSIGLVHRDLKPANLFLTRRADGSPLVKVLDFGISKAVSASPSAETAGLTTGQAILGSPSYMSPEQARTPKAVDERTDIWSLGIILFEFLTGRVPFTGDTLLSVIAAAVTETPPNILTLRPELPSGIESVVERCLSKSPDARFQTVAELADALAGFAEPHSLPSVKRIRGTVLRRSSVPPPMSGSPSRPPAPLEPGIAPGPRPPDSTPHDDTVALGATPSSHSETAALPKSQTVTDWGAPSARPSRSRRRMIIVGGAVAVLLALALVFAMRSNVASSEAREEPTTAARPAGSDERAELAPADTAKATGAPVVAPAPVDLPADPTASATVRPSGEKPPESAKPPAATKRTTPPASTATRSRPVSPLDGRL